MKLFIVIAVILLLLVAVAFFARETIFQAIGDFLVIQYNLHPADLIHVIAGEDHRTEYAIQLYHKGFGEILFFTGGCCNSHQYTHGEHARQLALDQDISMDAISIDDNSVSSTYSEAVRLREFISNNPAPIKSVIIVSDPHHMRRARWTYRRVLGNDVKVQMAPVPFDASPYQRRWWTDWESKKMVKEEYQKIAYYYARYKFSWGALREWLASFDSE